MGDTQIIAANLTVNTDEAQKNYLKLKGTVADLKKEFNNAKAGSDEQLAALKKLKAAEEDLAKTGKQLADANKENTGHFSKLKEGISTLPGATGAAGRGVEGLNAQFKALLANPIGLVLAAIVLVLTTLYKAFTNTFEGGQKMEQVFAGIKAAGQALLDNLTKIGSAIVKLMKFDFSGAVEEIKGVAKSAADAYGQMAKLTAEAQKLAREQADNDLDQAKRQAKLAELRAKAADGSISAAERKKAAKELLEESKKNAEADLDLAERIAKNKIGQLTVEKEGREKNYIEIKKIEAEQIQNATANSNELKQIGKQVTAAEREEIAEQKAAQQKAAEEAKKRRQELAEFTNKLTKLRQDNELAIIKDGYERELKALEFRIADEKKQNQQAFNDKKLTREQLNKLNEALDIQANLQKDAIDEKHNKEVAAKETAFQKELSAITNKIRIDGIKDARQSELVQLEIGYQEKLAQAIEKYKDDAAKLAQIQNALDEQYRIEKAAKEAKFKEEDDKKKLEKDLADQEQIIKKQNFDFDAKRAAADQEQLLIQQAFENKLISEQEYNTKVAALAGARATIREQEAAHYEAIAGAIASTFGTLANIAGKQTVAGKALAIAQTTIQTFQSAIGAFKGMVTTVPGPAGIAIGIAAQAGALANGIAAVKKIISTKIPGASDTGGSVPAAITAPSAPIAPTQTSTSLDQGTINNIGNAAAGGVNAVRAYVVEQDNAAAANRAARLAGAAVLGG